MEKNVQRFFSIKNDAKLTVSYEQNDRQKIYTKTNQF